MISKCNVEIEGYKTQKITKILFSYIIEKIDEVNGGNSIVLKYLDEDDFKKLQILYYLENHHLSTVLFDDLIEELHLNNYQVKKLLSEIQSEIKSWKLENYYLIDLQTQKSFVRYERRTQENIMLLLNHYVKRSQMQALIRAVFTEEVNKIAELEDVVFLSKSATYKLVKKFTDLTREYGVTIDKNMRFVGDEWKIREFWTNVKYLDTK